MPANHRKLKIVLAAHTPSTSRFVVGSHHLAREFSQLGHTTAHLVKPLTIWHLGLLHRKNTRQRLRLWADRSGHVHDPYLEFCPFIFLNRRKADSGVNAFRSALPRSVQQKITNPDWLLVDEPQFAGLENLLQPKLLVYRPTDHYQAGNDDPILARNEKALACAADAWVLTAESLLDHLTSLTNGQQRPHLILENGVSYRHLSEPAAEPHFYKSVSRPRAVYVGSFDERFDFAGMAALAKSRPEVNFILIGPLSRHKRALLSYPNVDLRGEVPYANIPSYLQWADVGLLPLSDDVRNAARSPMKIYEYAAAGLNVVARNTREIARRREPFVHVYNDSGEFVRALDHALSDAAPQRQSIQKRAEETDWRGKALQLIDFLHQVENDKFAQSAH